MKGIYRVTSEAKSDLRSIYRYGLLKWGEKQADKYYFALYDRFDQIVENPFIYPTANKIRSGYRVSVCGVDSIYYCINGDNVEIMAILGRQNRTERL
jgi:toxin ParE1/3/4